MKRWLLKLGLLLLAGAIVNVAVAWVCVLNPWRSPQSGSTRSWLPANDDLNWWRIAAPEPMDEPQSAGRLTIPGVDQDLLMGQGRAAGNLRANETILEETIRTQAGWPARALRGARFNYVVPPPVDRTASKLWWSLQPPEALIASKIKYQRPLIPLQPTWPGFAINTIFYAAVLWLLFAAPRSVRRWRRIRRGLCPACGYPVGEIDVCTECGRAVSPQRGGGI